MPTCYFGSLLVFDFTTPTLKILASLISVLVIIVLMRVFLSGDDNKMRA
jgi:hypothetical protein